METTYALILNFASEHYFLTWCALWLAWAPFLLVVIVLNFTLRIVIGTYRALVITLRGWPPAHVDADGDRKPASKTDAQ